MKGKMGRLTSSQAWKNLQEHQKVIARIPIRKLFETEPGREKQFSFELGDILFDFSKNKITKQTLNFLTKLAEEEKLPEKIEAMFSGEKINSTEKRAALHIALRNLSNEPIKVDGWDVMPRVNAVLLKMQNFTQQIHNGYWRGFSGESITDVVHIGIGGSDLGPRLVCESLAPYRQPEIRVHFVSNVDGTDIQNALRNLNPSRTLFIIASKSFTTQETLLNANTAKRWLQKNGSADEKDIAKHFVALSTNEEACMRFGIPPDNMFHFWNWVGGRFSLWSAIGLVICLYIGFENFYELLAGANEIDKHFRNTNLEENIPTLMALLGIWYNNFFGYKTYAIVPYDTLLQKLPFYLQQLIMESNGKRINNEGEVVDYSTSPIVWGQVGTDAQHSFFQLLHQGTQIVPIDFLIPIEPQHPFANHHDVLVANAIAQSEALMEGKTKEQVEQELVEYALESYEQRELVPHRVFPGDRPSTTIFYRKLTPRTLGMLLALYEHRVFVEGAILGINSFDQWGVELGKKIANNILANIESGNTQEIANPSSRLLITHYLQHRKR